MRINSFSIRNYKGLEYVSVDGLSDAPVLLLTGRNGTGKSLVLEALAGVWSQRVNLTSKVGPWGSNLEVSITVSLDETEWEATSQWARVNQGAELDRAQVLTYAIRATKASTQVTVNSPSMAVLQNTTFQREHPFSVIDILPATRAVPHAGQSNVDLAMMGQDRIESERTQIIDQSVNQRGMVQLPSVANFLLTFDYRNFLAERQGLLVEDEYARMAQLFNEATGKVLLKPQYDALEASHISVQVGAGHRHSLGDLSSGEQELLAMVYFVRRLSAAGGVLLIDEPEQHLHPSLQTALFESMRTLAQRAQAIVVTHSVGIVASAPLACLAQVTTPDGMGHNQISLTAEASDRLALVEALGLSASDLSQNDLLMVVEGETDAQWLKAAFPVELGRAHIYVAGGKKQVKAAHRTLEEYSPGVPWICVVDRDLDSNQQVANLAAEYAHCFIWSVRAIESVFLHRPLLERLAARLGKALTETLDDSLERITDPLRDEVLRLRVESAIAVEVPLPEFGGGSKIEKLREMFDALSSMNAQRSEKLDDVLEQQSNILDDEWTDVSTQVVNPKPVIAQLATVFGFTSASNLMSALVSLAREEDAVCPPDLQKLGTRLSDLLER